jgi:flavin-dependent dehydrogenase
MRHPHSRNLAARFFDARTSVRCTLLTAGWLAIGDAMLALDPLSGSGVVRAIEGALEVCDWLEQTDGELGHQPPMWSLRQKELLINYTIERRRIYTAERRWVNFPFWLRRGSANDNEKSEFAR